MSFTDAIRVCFAKYADFGGRASRPEFWWFTLFTVVGSVACGVVSDKLSLAFTVAVLLPSFAVAARRLHDLDKSGWLQLVGLVPILGWIIMIYWLAQPGVSASRFADRD